jgi:LacI family transcriptional regulator
MPKKMSKSAPGIVEVAALAGVSPATVSRFYNMPAVVRAPTRERIERAAYELGYIRNRAAGALQNRPSGAIGLIVPTIDNSIFAEMIQAFASRLRQTDRSLLIAAHGYDLDEELNLLRSLLEHRIDGVALVGFDHAPELLNLLKSRGTAVISVWNYRAGTNLRCVGTDNTLAGQLVLRHLIELGHRRIGLVFPDTHKNDRARDRAEGVLKQAAAAGIAIPQKWRLQCAYSTAEAKSSVKILLARSDRPTALICGNDIIAHGAIYAAQSLGLKLPEQLSITGVGDFQGSAEIEPGLTTVRLPARRIGARAADAIVNLIEGRADQSEAEGLIKCNLVVRGSTAPPPAS